MLKAIERQVVVVTGASSGIGLATALLAARRGAKVGLISRNREALEAVRDRIQRLGGEAAVAVADVAEADAVDAAAREIIAHFGRIDTWVNNAGVGLFGHLTDTDIGDNRRVFETNFWGVVNGSRTAVREMKAGGALINLGSAVSDRAFPLQGIYSASKHAIKGFTDALRVELMERREPISVTLVKPGAVATPFVQNAMNVLGREPKLPSPLYRPEDVAHAILHAATHPVRDIYVGAASKAISLSQLAPRVTDWFSSKTMYALQTRPTPAEKTDGNLAQPKAGGATRGRHPGQFAVPSLYTRLALLPTPGALALGGLAAAAALYTATSRRSRR